MIKKIKERKKHLKKVYIEAYLFKNLGDDLFIKIMTERYKNTKFYAQTRESYRKDTFEDNLKLYSNISIGIINKLFEKVFHKYNYVGEKLKKQCDYMVSIGGSIFMEKQDFSRVEKQFYIYDNSKPIYILGANFGPYQTKKYKEYVKNILRKSQDVSFRDEKSYKEFEDLKNVRFNSDIVFGLNLDNIQIKNKKNVVISVIECDLKGLSKEKEGYELLLLQFIKSFIKKGYTITLMSFCKRQGDEKVIKSLYKKCTKSEKNKIKKFYYKGNINDALDEIAQSEIMIGSRFHANILGFVMKKKVLPIAYSDKTINVLNDLDFKGKVIDIRKLEEFNIDKFLISDIGTLSNIEENIKSAKKQFEKLDEVLKDSKGENNEKEK